MQRHFALVTSSMIKSNEHQKLYYNDKEVQLVIFNITVNVCTCALHVAKLGPCVLMEEANNLRIKVNRAKWEGNGAGKGGGGRGGNGVIFYP